jgi:predicted  nucleic acid-binding Zn-ribbon protein
VKPTQFTALALSFLLLTSGPFVFAEGSKSSDIKVETDPAPSLRLTNDQVLVLENLIKGLLNDLDTQGQHQSAKNMTLSKFAEKLQDRFHLTSNSDTAVLKTMDFHLNGSVAQWITDNGYNMMLLAFIKSLAINGSLDVNAIAKEEGIDIELLRNLSFRMPSWNTISAVPGLASEFGVAALKYESDRVFNLTPEGKPVALDPTLNNIFQHSLRISAQFSKTTLERNPSLFGRIRDHFLDAEQSFESIQTLLKDIQVAALDIQGAIDSIHYKLTMAKKPQQVLELGRLLTEVKAHRERIITLTEPLLLVENVESLPFSNAFRLLNRKGQSARTIYAETRRLCSKIIDQIDRVLSADGSVEASLANDTPWELSFKLDEERDKMVAASGRWEEIREHQYIVHERYYTEHWTTTRQVDDYDSKGNRTGSHTETDHHYSSHSDDIYETFNTPRAEMSVADQIQSLSAQLAQTTDASELTRLKSKIEDLHKDQAAYVSEEPQGDHDYSDKYLARNRNLLSQIKNLISEAAVKSVQLARKMQNFNRAPQADPGFIAGVKEKLKQIDTIHSRHIHNAIVTTAVTAGTGAVGYCIYLFLQSGGM